MTNDEKKYCVYVHTNKHNGKVYVGQTCQKPSQRWRNGLGYKREPKFFAAIQKYGWDSFNHEIIAEKLTKEEANALEIQKIEEYQAYGEKGYNLTQGGSFNPMDYPEHREKVSCALKGKNNPMFGKTLSKETRQKISEKNKQYWKNMSQDEYDKQCKQRQGKNNGRAKQTLCVETGVIYGCARDAAEALGYPRQQGGVNICNAVKKNTKSMGYHWRYVN